MKSGFGSGLAALLMLAALPASAAMTDWSNADGGRMRLSALSEADPGKMTAILEIEPAPGWKTYWRNPGDAGMPPQIDLSTARNLKLVRVDYPVPEIGRDEAGRFFGYHQPVTLVLQLQKIDPAQPSMLSANVLVGLCREICLPFQSHFELPLDDISQPQADEFMNIQMARATLPEPPSSGFEVVRSGLSADGAFFEATVSIPGSGLPEVAVAPSEGILLGKQAEIMNMDGKVEIRYPVTRLPKSLDGATITLLVKSAGRAMETTLAVK
ncbi:MAG: cytochrome biosis protein [Rhizobium sp.]|nr:cytochrome biosis protein [Rhizobium sp.]